MTQLKYQLADIEYAISVKLRPTFLIITNPNETLENEVQILLSCGQFTNKTIQERVAIVFNLILQYVPDILDEYLVIVQAYSNDEMEILLDDIFQKELR